jgi:hypothetical protein
MFVSRVEVRREVDPGRRAALRRATAGRADFALGVERWLAGYCQLLRRLPSAVWP